MTTGGSPLSQTKRLQVYNTSRNHVYYIYTKHAEVQGVKQSHSKLKLQIARRSHVLPQDLVVVRVAGAGRRLEAVDVVAPPGPAGPPRGAGPDVRVLREVVEQARDGLRADGVGAAGELAEDALLAVGSEPGCGALDALRADGVRDAEGC